MAKEDMCTFKDFLRWYNNKDVVPTSEAMRKIVAFYHKKWIDKLKLGYTLPNIAYFCHRQSFTAKFSPSQIARKICLKKYAKTWLVDHSRYLQGKLLWTRFWLESQQTGAKPLSELVQISCILSRCVKQNQCQLDCTQIVS